MEIRGPHALTNQRVSGSMFDGCCAQGSQPPNSVCNSAFFFAIAFSWCVKRRSSKNCLSLVSAKFLSTNLLMMLRMPDDVAFSDSIEESWPCFGSFTKKAVEAHVVSCASPTSILCWAITYLISAEEFVCIFCFAAGPLFSSARGGALSDVSTSTTFVG